MRGRISELGGGVGAGDDVAADVVGVARPRTRRGSGRRWRRCARAGRGRSVRSGRAPRARRRRRSRSARGRRPRPGGRRRPSGSGSARYCWPTRTKGRSGMRPRLMSRSAATSSSKEPIDVDGAGAAAGLRHPGHAPLDREVDLEGAGAVPVAAVGAGDPAGEAVAGDLGDGARREVEDDRVGAVELGQRTHPHPRLDPCRRARAAPRPARRRSTASRPPPPASRSCAPAAISAIPTAALIGRVSGLKEWAATPPNSARAAGERQRRASSVAGAAAGMPKRASRSGCFGRCSSGRSTSSFSASKLRGGRLEQPAPGAAVGAESRRGLLDRAHHHCGAAVVERMGEVDLGPAPLQPVRLQPQRAQEGRGRRHRVRRRADVVDHARARSARRCGCRRRSSPPPRAPSPARRPAPAPPRRPARWGRSRRLSPRSRGRGAGLGGRMPPRHLDREVPRLFQPGLARRPCRRRRPTPPPAGRSRRRRSRSAGGRCRPPRTPVRSPAPPPARSRSVPAPPPAAAARGSGRRRSSSR